MSRGPVWGGRGGGEKGVRGGIGGRISRGGGGGCPSGLGTGLMGTCVMWAMGELGIEQQQELGGLENVRNTPTSSEVQVISMLRDS